MARAYLKIHQSDDPELKESYPKALKESLKYCTKFIKKDKENEYVPDLLDFIEELRAEAIAAADTEMDAEKYTRAKSMYSYLSKLDKTDPSAYIMLGLANYYARSTRDAEQQWATASQLMGSMTGRIAASEETELLPRRTTHRVHGSLAQDRHHPHRRAARCRWTACAGCRTARIRTAHL